MGCVSPEELEALALGEVPAARAAELRAHAAGCAECGRELKLVEREVALIRGRAARNAPVSPAVWTAVEARLEADKVVQLTPKRRRWLGVLTAVGAAAAAAFAVSIGRPHQIKPAAIDAGTAACCAPAPSADDDKDLEAAAALDGAEHDYKKIFQALEVEAQRAAARDPAAARRIGNSLSSARAFLASASKVARNDPEARMRVIEGYAAYLRTLQRAVDLEEMNP